MKAASILILLLTTLLISHEAPARTKLVALPDRETTRIRLDHPQYTLVEEERTLTLHKGINKIDFSWKGVKIDADSIRLRILQHPDNTRLINVSYPPAAQALAWDIYSPEGRQEKIRISYLLSNIDRVITYEAATGKEETTLDLASYLVLRNFSGESFTEAGFSLDYGKGFTRSIADGETKRLLFFNRNELAIKKTFTFDAGKQPWEPDKQKTNVGIPVHYELENTVANQLGQHALWGGKVRIYQNAGHGSSIFLGEDAAEFTPVDENMRLYIGDSRDLVVTQRKTRQEQKNVRRNRKNRIILHDLEETIRVEVENFKDLPAQLQIIEPMSGEWSVIESSHTYEREHAGEFRFNLHIPAGEKRVLEYRTVTRNIRS